MDQPHSHGQWWLVVASMTGGAKAQILAESLAVPGSHKARCQSAVGAVSRNAMREWPFYKPGDKAATRSAQNRS